MVKEFGYEYDAVLNEKIWTETRDRCTESKWNGACCLRSGRDALKAIAREYSPCKVLLPALSCDSMVYPFELYHHNIIYYKLNADYSVDLNDLKKKLDEDTCLLLYMDYFGCPSISDDNLNALRNSHSKMVFIEDRTHNLIWEKENTFHPEYIVASLRKWLAVPDGGLLWGHITQPLKKDTAFSKERLRAQLLRHEFLENGNKEIKTEYRHVFSTVTDMIDQDDPGTMSEYAYMLAVNTDWDKLRDRRRSNSEVLSCILQSHVHLISQGLSSLYVPFTVKNRNEVQRRLSGKGIFNTIIWPLSDEQKKVCQVARYTEENMLAAPCDQRYTPEDMKYIGQEIIRVIEETNG